MPDLLADLAALTAARKEVDGIARDLLARWEATIRAALERDCRAAEVARAAGVTTQRVYQIGQKP